MTIILALSILFRTLAVASDSAPALSTPAATTATALAQWEVGYRAALRTVKRLERENHELREEIATLKKEILQLMEDGD